MRKLFIATAFAASLSWGAYAEQITGYISDSHCGAKHDTVSEANTKCIQGCLRHGSEPVLVSNGKVYKMTAESRDSLEQYAGKNVTIDGTENGDTITVESIKVSQ
jgi:hypothetical protein